MNKKIESEIRSLLNKSNDFSKRGSVVYVLNQDHQILEFRVEAVAGDIVKVTNADHLDGVAVGQILIVNEPIISENSCILYPITINSEERFISDLEFDLMEHELKLVA